MPKRTHQTNGETFTELQKFASVQEIESAINSLERRIQDIEALRTERISYNSQRVTNVESSIRSSILDIFGPHSPEFGEYREYRLFYPELAFTTSRQFAERLKQENENRFLVELPEAKTMLLGLIERLQEKRSNLTPEKAPAQNSPDLDSIPGRPPRAFLSYSHDSPEHRAWVRGLAARLRQDGVETILDQWELVPGDQVPQFMERAVRENHFVLIVCTPRYKERSDARVGGVGYEGDIMTAEVYRDQSHRKFIPILRSGEWSATAPSWLSGKYFIDLRGDPYSEEEYLKLRNAIHGTSEKPPPVRAGAPHDNSVDRGIQGSQQEPTKRGWDREQSSAAGRDVLAEAITNVRRVLSVEATTLHYEIADGAWRQQRPEVARLFDDDWDGLQNLVGAYDAGASISTNSRAWNPFQMSATHQREAKDLLLRHAEDWLKAIHSLKPKVLAPGKAAKVDSEMEELRKRLATARQIIELDRKRG